MLENFTFGNSPAAVTLVKIINDNNISPIKIGKLLANFNHTLKELSKIDTKVSISLVTVFYHQKMEVINTYPIIVKSYLKNVVTTKYRMWLDTQKAAKPYKTRCKLNE